MSLRGCPVCAWFWSCSGSGLRGCSGSKRCRRTWASSLSCCRHWACMGLARGNRPARGCTGLAGVRHISCRLACGTAYRGSQVACSVPGLKSCRRHKLFRASQMACSGAERLCAGFYWAGKATCLCKRIGSQRGLFEGLQGLYQWLIACGGGMLASGLDYSKVSCAALYIPAQSARCDGTLIADSLSVRRCGICRWHCRCVRA